MSRPKGNKPDPKPLPPSQPPPEDNVSMGLSVHTEGPDGKPVVVVQIGIGGKLHEMPGNAANQIGQALCALAGMTNWANETVRVHDFEDPLEHLQAVLEAVMTPKQAKMTDRLLVPGPNYQPPPNPNLLKDAR